MIQSTRQQMIDQSAHFAAGLLIVLVVGLLLHGMTILAGLFIAFMVGLAREQGQHGWPKHGWFGSGTNLDLAFWTLGGLVAALIV